jgi:hypothetical protein
MSEMKPCARRCRTRVAASASCSNRSGREARVGSDVERDSGARTRRTWSSTPIVQGPCLGGPRDGAARVRGGLARLHDHAARCCRSGPLARLRLYRKRSNSGFRTSRAAAPPGARV